MGEKTKFLNFFYQMGILVLNENLKSMWKEILKFYFTNSKILRFLEGFN